MAFNRVFAMELSRRLKNSNLSAYDLAVNYEIPINDMQKICLGSPAFLKMPAYYLAAISGALNWNADDMIACMKRRWPYLVQPPK